MISTTTALNGEPGEIRYYVDDELYYTVNDWFTGEEGGDDVPYPAPFNKFLCADESCRWRNMAGNPDATTDFDNAELQIDYVRVYQKPEYDTNVTKPPMVSGILRKTATSSITETSLNRTVLTAPQTGIFSFLRAVKAVRISDNEMVNDSTSEGTEQYSVQLVQPDLPMEKGKPTG